MFSASAPAFWSAGTPFLSSFDNEQQCGYISRINELLPNLLLGSDACGGVETLTKTWMLLIFMSFGNWNMDMWLLIPFNHGLV